MRKLLLGFVFLLTIADSCNNGVVGVQDYGSITGRVLDATTNRPIPNAIVSVGSLYTTNADINGAFTLPRVPIGLQTVDARMPGFRTVAQSIRIKKDQNSQAGFLRLVPIAKPDVVATLPPPPTPTPEASIEPTWSPPGATAAPTPTANATAAPSAAAATPSMAASAAPSAPSSMHP